MTQPRPIRRLLIANRGEIACRVIRTARRLGIETVSMYSDADADALHVRQANRAVRIGPAPARDSYLDIDAVLAAVRATGADALHPGYGFLSENARFADACEAAGCLFVGPPAPAIAAMGDKAESKRIAADAGVAVVPGYHGTQQTLEQLVAAAAEIGYPLLIKPSAGGGGKGMRRVTAAAELETAIAAAKREASAAFGDDRLLLERFLEAPKHIEVQLLADTHGNVVHVFERDCSVQRRHQKVIEEAPAPVLDAAVRERLGAAAVALARAIGYRSAGTVEFIGAGDEYFFMEMNTRLQVEHPVTELVTGLDLVEWQLRIAAGEALPFAQCDLALHGCAIEARIYAENPQANFLPSTGRIVHLAWPTAARVDAGIEQGATVGTWYDPMLAKIIAHGPDRAQAIAALDHALSTTELAGVEHNVAFLRRVLAHDDFRSGQYDIGLVERSGAPLLQADVETDLALIAAAVTHADPAAGPWQRADGFRMNLASVQTLRLAHASTERQLQVVRRAANGTIEVRSGAQTFVIGHITWGSDDVSARVDGTWLRARLIAAGRDIHYMRGGTTLRVTLIEDDTTAYERDVASSGRIIAPMPGQVLALHVAPGDAVTAGQRLLVLEAMKMEHTIVAPADGTVASVAVAVGGRVEEGADLIVIE